ncbi:MAG: DUF1800 family protein [Acidobacteria bacterium]|nr:DUF1800 family protein [Acidobacteriota bacterium]
MLAASVSLLIACGGAGGQAGGGTKPPKPAISLTPAKADIHAGQTQKFVASVTGMDNTAVSWSVNGVAGGNATVGSIDNNGLYTAPELVPSQNPVKVQAASMANQNLTASSSVTVKYPLPSISSVTPDSITPPSSFTLTVNGKNFAAGAVVVWGTLFLPTTYVSSTQLTATGSQSSPTGGVAVTVMNPDPNSGASNAFYVQTDAANALSAPVAARFLQQSSWGPTPRSQSDAQVLGISRYLTYQFGAPMSTYPAPAKDDNISDVQSRFFNYALQNPDQLRQRVAFALSQVMVVSSNKVGDPSAFVLWQNMMQKDAFGNFYDLLKDVTLSPVMGNYLDMVNNDKPDPSRGINPNENYAREVLQLFTIGLDQLNPDGTVQVDGSGVPIPTYSQEAVEGFAHVFTGWTYPTKPGNSARFNNPEYYGGPMIAIDSHHDTSAKTLLNGVTIPAGGTANSDLETALRNIFNHPNVGPFIGRRLIQHLVTSNPTPEYIGRVTAVFNDNGSGVRGDLKAVVTAILTDPEARRGDDPTQLQGSDGHLKEPVLYITHLLRALNANTYGGSLRNYASDMQQAPMTPPSVFNYYHPDHVLEGTNLLGPEFELLNTSTAISRINFANDVAYGGSVSGDTTMDLSPYLAVASDPAQLVDKLGAILMCGQMSSDMRSTLITTVSAIPNNTRRVQAALYLIASSSQFQVER